MWLGEQAGKGREAECAHARIGTVSIGGASPAAELGGECRALGIIGAAGVLWRPEAQQQALVLETDDGERFVLGTVQNAADTPEAGELCLRCGETLLRLSAQGVSITGRFYLNGMEVAIGGE